MEGGVVVLVVVVVVVVVVIHRPSTISQSGIQLSTGTTVLEHSNIKVGERRSYDLIDEQLTLFFSIDGKNV